MIRQITKTNMMDTAVNLMMLPPGGKASKIVEGIEIFAEGVEKKPLLNLRRVLNALSSKTDDELQLFKKNTDGIKGELLDDMFEKVTKSFSSKIRDSYPKSAQARYQVIEQNYSRALEAIKKTGLM